MSTQAHDNLCDTGQPCAMCVDTGLHEGLAVCCELCNWSDKQEQQVTIPTFTSDWEQAPRTVRRLITEADAEYFWLRGQQAGRVAEQVELRKWLVQMMEDYDERVGK